MVYVRASERAARFEARFEARVDRSGGPDACHLWTGIAGTRGYGQCWSPNTRNRSAIGAHRVAYERANGPIPDGLFVCHRCDVRLCVNPAHLFLGTAAENNADRDAKGRHRVAKGEANHSAKLTAPQVRRIRERCQSGESRSALAREYGVAATSIYEIATRRTWRHV